MIDQTGVQRWYVSIPDGAGAEEMWDGPSLTEVLGGMSTNYSSPDARRRQAMHQVQASHQQRRGPARPRLTLALANRLTHWSV